MLNIVTSFSYLGHIISNDLSDDADLKAKSRQIYGNAKSNALCQKFHMCATAVKVNLFTAYFSNVYMCALWVNYRKTTFHQFTVAYNNSYRILNKLPMRCSASGMFATDNVNSCTCVIRKSIYSLTTRIFTSTNPIIIVKSIWGGGATCIVCRLFVTYGFHYCILCSFDLVRQSLAFVFLLFNSMDTLYMYVCIILSEINYYYY